MTSKPSLKFHRIPSKCSEYDSEDPRIYGPYSFDWRPNSYRTSIMDKYQESEKPRTIKMNGANGISGAGFVDGVSDIESLGSAKTAHDEDNHSSPPPNTSFSFNSTRHAQHDWKRHIKGQGYIHESNREHFPRISRPIELLRNTYDVVVIGSGYGGGVAASRMARAGKSVCLLERGKERWPGEYPSALLPVLKDLHISGSSKLAQWGDPTGLYHLLIGEGQNAFVGNGLGGTSLINANVYLRADERTLSLHDWPKELREPGALDPYYELAEHMLEPEPYPDNWPELPKLKLLEKQAVALGLGHKFRRVTQTTRFAQGANSTGVEMNASTLLGQDVTGLNDMSKSSTLVNYLADAWNWGAEMFCECEVRYVKKQQDGNGYIVYFAWHGSNRGAFKKSIYEDLMWVHAKECVFLGAGSLGSTEILLRSQKMGFPMSTRVGMGMSGNGDIVSYGYNCNEEANCVGREQPRSYHPVGPTITGTIDCRDGHENHLDGFVIQEGAIPQVLAPIFQALVEMMPFQQAPSNLSQYEKLKRIFARSASHLLGPYFSKGSMQRSQVYLIMSHDSNQAVLTLKNDKPVLKFLGVGRSYHAKKLRNLLARATAAVGGTYVDNPFFATMTQQEITVHPIGGACMSSDGTASNGVTNHFGQVLTGNGDEVYHGLVVTDGALIPTALGVNPFATITALAERSVKHIADNMGLNIDYSTKNGTLDLFGPPRRSIPSDNDIRLVEGILNEARSTQASGIDFSEMMSGHIHMGASFSGNKKDDYELAARTARSLCQTARFFLSVKVFNTETFINRPDHSGVLTGSFTCAALPGSPFMVNRGQFQLFNNDLQMTGTKNITYDFDITGVNGEVYHFHGFKIVDSSVTLNPLELWRVTSTLYVTLSYIDGPIIGRGILQIQPQDLVSQAFTLTSSGRNFLAKSWSYAQFLRYFIKQSTGLFLTPFTNLQYPASSYRGFVNDTPVSETIKLTASDGVKSLLRMWEKTPNNPDLEVHDLLMIPGGSVDHQIFSLPTIEYNAVNYFTNAGYRVWVLVHRTGITAEAEKNWTTFDTRLDIRAAYEYIRKVRGPQKLYTIAHCLGAVALSSGLLDGTIPGAWIKGITCSQVFMNLKLPAVNAAKVSINAIGLYKLLAGNWLSFSSSPNDSLIQKILNQLLRFYPTSSSEMCTNVACHRISLAFGRLWSHHNLNEATHRALHRFFGGVNMTLLHAISQQGVSGHVATNFPVTEDLVTPERLQRLKGIPIFLFSGGQNMAWSPESTYLSYALLRHTFGSQGYERCVVEGYGHLDCWMGTNAYKDVYPMVRQRVDAVCRGKKI